MDDLTLINNTSVYRNPAPQSPLQGQGVMQPSAVYSKIMLRTIELSEQDFLFDGLAVERTMPSNNGSNEIVFKRMLSLAAHTQPLVEGIPPASDQGRMVAIKASTNMYGRVMKFTDKVNWAVVDPLISEYTRQLSLKIPETKDLLAQEALLAECQMFYAATKTRSENDSDHLIVDATAKAVNHVKFMNPDCAPTIDEFRKIVLSMEAAKVRPYQGSNFLVLASSAVLFDLITDKRVKEFMKYESTGRAYSNDMVIDLFSLAFKKAKTIKTDNTYVDGDGYTNYIYHETAASGRGKNYILIGTSLENATTATEVIVVNLDTNTAANKAAFSTLIGDSGKAFTSIADAQGKLEALNVHYSFVLGEECLFRIGVEGHTQPQFIKKELGSAGTEDPLNQRQSIGWKIDSLGYKVPNPDAVVAYLSCPTQYKINVNARPDVRNQFTDYKYGYMDGANNYFYPEQVMQTLVDGEVKYYVKGTNVEVHSVKMTDLVKPINGGRIDNATGKKHQVVGTTPTSAYILKKSVGTATPIRFLADQVVAGTSDKSKFYIAGLAQSEATEVVALPQHFTQNVPKADGTGYEDITVIDQGVPAYNLTGDPRIDNKGYTED
jgi:N4-gp56 family major capsid protein